MAASWRKPSHGHASGECAEVATGGTVLVRDSKDPDGPQPALSLPGVLPGDGSPLAHALRRLAAEQADPAAEDPIACHDSYT